MSSKNGTAVPDFHYEQGVRLSVDTLWIAFVLRIHFGKKFHSIAIHKSPLFHSCDEAVFFISFLYGMIIPLFLSWQLMCVFMCAYKRTSHSPSTRFFPDQIQNEAPLEIDSLRTLMT